jgi:hypothetical protein
MAQLRPITNNRRVRFSGSTQATWILLPFQSTAVELSCLLTTLNVKPNHPLLLVSMTSGKPYWSLIDALQPPPEHAYDTTVVPHVTGV